MTEHLRSELIKIIITEQNSDGSFSSYSSPSRDTFILEKKYTTTFFTSLILECLNRVHNPDVDQTKKRAAQFLRKQKSNQWTFNYWAKDTKESREQPYPDDLDDTFCALSALYGYDRNIISGEVMHAVSRVLIATEKRPGGPYKTWLVDNKEAVVWQDCDIAVNANVAYFLHLNKTHLPNLQRYFARSIKTNGLTSPYYPSELQVIYFLSRSGHILQKQKLIEQTNKFIEKPQTLLSLALLLLSGINLTMEHNKIEAIHTKVINKLKTDKVYPEAFCLDPAQNRVMHYAGAQALTAAFVLQAFSQYEALNAKQISPQAQLIQNKIESHIHSRLHFLPSSQKIISRIQAMPRYHEIILLPFQAKQHFKLHVNNDVIIKAGLLATYGWIAYTLYDDCLDQNNTHVLIAANIALRELSQLILTTVPNNQEFISWANDVIDSMEATQEWEIQNCRSNKDKKYVNFGKGYEKLAQRSLGHCIGTVSLLFAAGYKLKDPEIQSLIEFFKQMIIAQQLNDDAHDWKEDLTEKRLTPVTQYLIKNASSTANYDQLFLEEGIVHFAKKILYHVKQAERALVTLPFKDITFLSDLLLPSKRAAEEAMYEHKRAQEFLGIEKSP